METSATGSGLVPNAVVVSPNTSRFGLRDRSLIRKSRAGDSSQGSGDEDDGMGFNGHVDGNGQGEHGSSPVAVFENGPEDASGTGDGDNGHISNDDDDIVSGGDSDDGRMSVSDDGEDVSGGESDVENASDGGESPQPNVNSSY